MERRTDPEDGETLTLADMLRKYNGVFSDGEIRAYFRDECKPIASAAPTSGGYAAPASGGGCRIAGLEKWLQDRDLDQYLENVQGMVGLLLGMSSDWRKRTPLGLRMVRLLQEVEENFDDIKGFILASEIEPGERVRVKVLQGKWKGQYVAEVLGTNSQGLRIRHEEDDFEETLAWAALGGDKYAMEPVTDDEEDAAESSVVGHLWSGRLRVDADEGAGVELRWVKWGYCVDSVDVKPGQPDLRASDVIVACGSAILAGLTEDEVERRFGGAIGDGVALVAGPLNELMRRSVEDVSRDAQRLMEAGPK